ncbi:MAG: M23 family metallopeptidase, partial [Acidimicrobiia bacterium]
MGLRSKAVQSTALVAVFGVALAALAPAAAASAAPPPTDWLRPVAGAVVRPFVAPRAKYGPGHRGADLAAAPGTAVAAAHGGVVAFAGSVAGSLHVVVDHGGGLVTSYSFLAGVGVRRGERVVRGQTLGVAGGTGSEHAVGVVHFGLRVDGEYLDPMTLFAPIDLTAVIRLVPVHSPDQVGLSTPATEARSLAESLRLPRAIPGLEPAGAPSWWDGAVDTATGLARPFVSIASAVLAGTPLGPLLTDLRTMGSRFAEYLHSRNDCTTRTAPGAGGGGSGHLMMAVGGINSSTDRRTGHTFGLDTAALGYHRGEVAWFSYAPGGGRYRPSDTWGDLLVKAYALRDQLRVLERRHPGREVDLVAHSQGGVVVD